jgi:hypothetical protein
MKYALALILATSSCAFAQDEIKPNVMYQRPGGEVVTHMMAGKFLGQPVPGAPYSATITNESVQTLADGNRIVQTSTGLTARDSQGRTRQDAPLPTIGNLAATGAPHLVFIVDPVAQVSYTLNLTDKTAQTLSTARPGGPEPDSAGYSKFFFAQAGSATSPGPMGPPLPPWNIPKRIVKISAPKPWKGSS